MFEYDDLNRLNKKPLSMFLKKHKLKSTGNIEDLAKTIKSAVEEKNITTEEYQKWRIKLLREGRKHVYVFSLDNNSLNKLTDVQEFINIKENKGLNLEQEVNNIDKPEIPTLAYCKEVIVNGTIEKINMLYVEKKTTYVPNYQSRIINTEEINYYVFININLAENIMIINLESTSGLRETDDEETDEAISSSKIAQRYMKKVCEDFEICTYDNREEFQDVLKELWKSTLLNSPEIEEKINSIDEYTEAYINQCVDSLKIENVNAEELKIRINNYWEKILVNQPFDEVDIQSNEVGYITKEKVRGASSQNLTLSVNKNVPLHLTDYHYDVKAAVDTEGNLTYLKFTWNGLEGLDRDIDTILEVFSGFFRVIFTKYSVEEEIDYVLSGIKRFKDQV